MEHFKILITTGKKQNITREMFVRAPNIISAMEIQRKVRKSRLKSLVSITYDQYMAGVDEKYKPPVWARDFDK